MDLKRHRETLDLAPTPPNIKHAERLVQRIRKHVARGDFNYSEFFPKSKHLDSSQVAPTRTFGSACDLYLESIGGLEDATKSQYKNAIEIWRSVIGNDVDIEKLSHDKLAALIGKYPWKSAKLFNNYLIPLRRVFSSVFTGKDTHLNPMNGIKNWKIVKSKPDPLDGDERRLILDDMSKNYPVQIWAYFAFAFGTGMRPEEVIALQWGDIDFIRSTALVQRVRTFKGSERDGTKTHTDRDVDLVPLAMRAIEAMRPFTSEDDAEIFEHPELKKKWHDDRSQRETYWQPCLRRLGIRMRRPYITRATYASEALLAGANPGYVSAQLGHANSRMLHEKYARWIEGADKGSQRKIMLSAINDASPQA